MSGNTDNIQTIKTLQRYGFRSHSDKVQPRNSDKKFRVFSWHFVWGAIGTFSGSFRGPKKAHELFQHKLFGPPPKTPRKSLCASFPGKGRKKGPTINFFRGIFGVQRGPKRAIFGHKKFSLLILLLFSCPYVFRLLFQTSGVRRLYRWP